MPYRPTERTEARRAETRERIASAALDQVAEGGYASAAVQTVARRASVAVGTVYRHFPSKADLFAEVFRRTSEHELELVERIAVDYERPVPERIAAAVETFCRRALASPVLAYAQLVEPVDVAIEAERLRLRRGHHTAFRRALDEGVRAGELAPHDTEVVAAALVGGLAEALVGPLSPNGGGRPSQRGQEALVASLVQFFLHAIPIREEKSRAHAAREHP